MNKGEKGYFQKAKKREQLKCVLQFGAVFLFLIIGYIMTKTKLNWFTFFAVLSCLPASKVLVGVIVKWKIHPCETKEADAIEKVTSNVTIIFDPILTSKEKNMPLQCLVISGNKVFGYTHSKNKDVSQVTDYLKTIYSNNKYNNMNVKVFSEFNPFLSRVEGLNNIASVNQLDQKDFEENIKHITLLYCM